MAATEVFSSKAEKYARYRWDYAPQAIQVIFEGAQITSQSVVADIGAGTGILTRHFIGKVKQVIAIEPNVEMRRIAVKKLGAQADCLIMDGMAEATSLPDHCIDLITAAQATNWFDPQPAKVEFERILKPGGWLALLRNYGTDHELDKALEQVYPAESDTAALMKGLGTQRSFYYGGQAYRMQTFPFIRQESWEEFFGALSTASYAPDEGSPLYAGFEQAARSVFMRFNKGGVMAIRGFTELYLGQIGTA